MAQKLIRKTPGLYRNTNELSETPEGGLLIANNLVIDRDSIIESRRGFDQLNFKFRDSSDRAHNVFIYRDNLLAHNSTDLMSRYDSTPVLVSGDFSSGGSTITNISPNTNSLSVGQTVIGTYVFEITTVADVSGSLNSKYFYFNSADNATRYYAWIDVSGAGVDPNVPGRTGVQISISTNDTANTVASTIQSQINALADFSASVLGNVVTVTNAAAGDNDIARNGYFTTSPGFTFNNIGTGIQDGTVIDSIDSSSQVTVSKTFTANRTTDNLSIAGWRNYNGTYTSPSTSIGRIRSASANQNFYFVSNTGVKKLDSLTGTIINAGGIRGIYGEGELSGASGFLNDNTQVAYRIVWGYKDANNNLILGVPSERIIIINNAGGTRDVQLTFFIPDGVTTDYFYQIYRSEQSVDATVQPSDELRLVYEDNPTSTELTAKEVVLVDNTPEDLRDGAYLYTSPSQEGILEANEVPPFAHDIAVFQNCTFYSNTRTKQNLTLTLLASGTGSGLQYVVDANATYVNATTFTVGAATGIVAGMLITGPGANIPANLYVDTVNGTTITVTGGTLTSWGGTITVQFRDQITIAGTTYTTNDLTQSDSEVTFTVASPGKVNWTSHGLTAGSTVSFTSTGTLPAAITAGVIYYVTNPGANDFEISATQDGTSINFADAGTGTHTALANSLRFQVFTAGSPAQNIEDTVKALLKVLNNNTSNTTVYGYYLSTPDELPGKFYIQARTVSISEFYATATSHGSAFNPVLPTSGTTVASTNDSFGNGLYFSKPLQPEAVPINNYLRIGDADKDILRIITLRDALFVFKPDGIFRITGSDPTTFRFDLLDNTSTLIAPESVVTLGNQIYAFCDQGIVAISDTGVEIVSRQIENDFLDLLSLNLDSVAYNTFAVSYESDRKYILGVITNDVDTSPTQMYIYNTFTKAWTKWLLSKTCGIVNPDDDRLIFGDANSNATNLERKSRSYTDYIDDEFELTLSSHSGTSLVLSSVSNVEIGDLIFQGNTNSSKITEVDPNTSSVTVQDTIDWIDNEAITIQKAIETTLQYIPEESDNPGVTKQYREISLFFKEGFFEDLELSFYSDLNNSSSIVNVNGYQIGFWGLFQWGSLPWGGITRNINIRTYVPADKQRCSQLSIQLRHREGYSYFALNGLSLIFNQMSERLKR